MSKKNKKKQGYGYLGNRYMEIQAKHLKAALKPGVQSMKIPELKRDEGKHYKCFRIWERYGKLFVTWTNKYIAFRHKVNFRGEVPDGFELYISLSDAEYICACGNSEVADIRQDGIYIGSEQVASPDLNEHVIDQLDEWIDTIWHPFNWQVSMDDDTRHGPEFEAWRNGEIPAFGTYHLKYLKNAEIIPDPRLGLKARISTNDGVGMTMGHKLPVHNPKRII